MVLKLIQMSDDEKPAGKCEKCGYPVYVREDWDIIISHRGNVMSKKILHVGSGCIGQSASS